MALHDESVDIDAPALRSEDKLAVILGTEGEGLQDATIADSDYTIKIPMSHGVDSLNVAAASAVAFWELGRQSGCTIEKTQTERKCILCRLFIRYPSLRWYAEIPCCLYA